MGRLGGSEKVFPDHARQSAVNSLPQRLNDASEMELRRAQLTDVLAELYDLLEQYAPFWYTEEQHERVESALRLLKKS
jgi:hypothetical protein